MWDFTHACISNMIFTSFLNRSVMEGMELVVARFSRSKPKIWECGMVGGYLAPEASKFLWVCFHWYCGHPKGHCWTSYGIKWSKSVGHPWHWPIEWRIRDACGIKENLVLRRFITLQIASLVSFQQNNGYTFTPKKKKEKIDNAYMHPVQIIGNLSKTSHFTSNVMAPTTKSWCILN